MGGLKGKCPKCGASYFGWALTIPLRQKCATCGSRLDILENGVPIRVVTTRATASDKMEAE